MRGTVATLAYWSIAPASNRAVHFAVIFTSLYVFTVRHGLQVEPIKAAACVDRQLVDTNIYSPCNNG